MSLQKRSFILNVSGEGIYLATKEHLLKYGYEPMKDAVPEIKVPKGRYGFVLEALKTPRGKLVAAWKIQSEGVLVLGDVIYVLPDDGYKSFIDDLYNEIIRGDVKTCMHLYMGKPGDYAVDLMATKI